MRDCEKIMHAPYYNRYADKTQVFSFYKNDDITRRALHVQLVARIARNIGSLLGLNVDLIEAICDISCELKVLLLVNANRHELGLIEQDIGCHK